MKLTKRRFNLVTYFLIFLFLVINTPFSYATPNITAPTAVLLDYTTGEVLYDHNAHNLAFPASTTKVMTSILVLENANLDDVLTINEDLYIDGSSMYLLKGESFTVKELLQGLLIRSANDAAEVLAKHVSGSIEDFADLMNKRARELGAKNTHFTNPHGLPDDNHVTTAYDLAIIAKHAMSFELFRDIVSTVRLEFPPTEYTPETRYYRNTNRFLWGTGGNNKILYKDNYEDIKYDIVDGIKTGYTGAAKQCLITSAIKDDHRLIAVVLGAEGSNVYLDSRTLIDYGFDNFKLEKIVDKNAFITNAPILNCSEDNIALYTDTEITAILPNDLDPSQIQIETIVDEDIKAPLPAGQILGRVIYSVDGKILGESNLISIKDMEAKPFIKKLFIPNTFMPVIIVFLLWQTFVIYKRIKRKRRRKSLYVNVQNYPSSYRFDGSLYRKK
ncbi:MAG: D-alanyl-D-alanine carboxypeptidase [Clostridiales bacterium]|nr:D-alanyl-D-alanine carboxypeptidase [Clostridiales bacterium]